MDDLHARVPGDDCVGVVAAGAAGGAVEHDLQANAAAHEVGQAGDGDGGARPARKRTPSLMKRAREGRHVHAD